MLTDIFAERYCSVSIWKNFGESERRLLVQAFRIVSDQLFPYWTSDGKEIEGAKAAWKSIHDRLAMELGLQQLAPMGYWAQTKMAGNDHQYWVSTALVHVCNSFVCGPYDGKVTADRFIKDRLSFVEIAFRDRENAIAKANAELPALIAEAETQHNLAKIPRIPGFLANGLRASNEAINEAFRANVYELNERFRRAGTKLNYHNGFIQIVEDEAVEREIESPFWMLVSDPKWANVDIDMKEAVDRRDGGGRDPGFYAAKALESTIKIISNEKGWTHGGERGAHSYIDNLASAKNGAFISKWEQSALKLIFSEVRNELGHGPGNQLMPELSLQQTSWVIESCMSWIKSLVRRM